VGVALSGVYKHARSQPMATVESTLPTVLNVTLIRLNHCDGDMTWTLNGLSTHLLSGDTCRRLAAPRNRKATDSSGDT